MFYTPITHKNPQPTSVSNTLIFGSYNFRSKWSSIYLLMQQFKMKFKKKKHFFIFSAFMLIGIILKLTTDFSKSFNKFLLKSGS